MVEWPGCHHDYPSRSSTTEDTPRPGLGWSEGGGSSGTICVEKEGQEREKKGCGFGCGFGLILAALLAVGLCLAVSAFSYAGGKKFDRQTNLSVSEPVLGSGDVGDTLSGTWELYSGSTGR
jgi:hypothetical protein